MLVSKELAALESQANLTLLCVYVLISKYYRFCCYVIVIAFSFRQFYCKLVACWHQKHIKKMKSREAMFIGKAAINLN